MPTTADPFDVPTTAPAPNPIEQMHLRGLPPTWWWADTFTFGPAVRAASPEPASWLRVVDGVHQILEVQSVFTPSTEVFDQRDDLVAVGAFRGLDEDGSPFFGRRIVSELYEPLSEHRDDTPTNVELGVALRSDVYAEVHLQGVTWTEVAQVLDALAGGADELLSLPPPVTGPRPAFGPVDGGASVVVVGSVGGASAVEWREPDGGAVRIVRTAADEPHGPPEGPDRGGRPATVLGRRVRIDTSTGVWSQAAPTSGGAGLWIVASGIAAPRLAHIVDGITLLDDDGWAAYAAGLPFESLV